MAAELIVCLLLVFFPSDVFPLKNSESRFPGEELAQVSSMLSPSVGLITSFDRTGVAGLADQNKNSALNKTCPK